MNHLAHAPTAVRRRRRPRAGRTARRLPARRRAARPALRRAGRPASAPRHRWLYRPRPRTRRPAPALRSARRRYARIIVDVLWFDHLLTRDFARWSAAAGPFSCALQALLQRSRRGIAAGAAALRRQSCSATAGRLRRSRRAGAGLHQAVDAAVARQSLADALRETARLEADLDAAFADFFPRLVRFAAGGAPRPRQRRAGHNRYLTAVRPRAGTGRPYPQTIGPVAGFAMRRLVALCRPRHRHVRRHCRRAAVRSRRTIARIVTAGT